MSEPRAKALAALVCHDEQMEVWAGEVVSALNMDGYIRDDMTYDDVVGLSETIKTELRSIVESAFDHPELPAPSSEGSEKPVAWRYRYEEGWEWKFQEGQPTFAPFSEPLYAHPPLTPVSDPKDLETELREGLRNIAASADRTDCTPQTLLAGVQMIARTLLARLDKKGDEE